MERKDGPICSIATETALRNSGKSVLDFGIFPPFRPKRQPGKEAEQTAG